MIGLWIARFTGSRRITRWHLVESEIADRKVTKCGRQMGTIDGTSVAPLVAPPSTGVACTPCLSPRA